MNLLRIFIVLAAGAIAFGANWIYINNKKPIVLEFVRTKEYIGRGTAVEESMLERIEITGDSKSLAQLSKTAIPWKERAVLYGRTLSRELLHYDIIFYRDTLTKGELNEPVLHLSLGSMEVISSLIKVGDYVLLYVPIAKADDLASIEYKKFGPHRVVTIGSVATRPPSGESSDSNEGEQMIAIAIDDKISEKTASKAKDKMLVSKIDVSGDVMNMLNAIKQAETSGRAKIRIVQIPQPRSVDAPSTIAVPSVK